MDKKQQAIDWFFEEPLAFQGMEMGEFWRVYSGHFDKNHLDRDQLWDVLRNHGITVEQSDNGEWVVTYRQLSGQLPTAFPQPKTVV